MPRTVYEEDSPVPQLEISGKDRERIAADAAWFALPKAALITAIYTAYLFLAHLFVTRQEHEWPLWANALGTFVISYLAFFIWRRNRLLREHTVWLDTQNERLRDEGNLNGRTDRTRLADGGKS